MRSRITEEVLHEVIEARTESLIGLRELGPPDLVHLLKQTTRNTGKQVRDVQSTRDLAAINPVHTDRRIPPCHRRRRLVLGQSCGLYQHPDVQREFCVHIENI